MVKYLTTKKSGKKKTMSKKKYNKKSKTKKNNKIIGGSLDELYNLDNSTKTIILMGEFHTLKRNILDYNKIIKKQKQIINLAVDKFGQDKTYFYSEAPEEYREAVFNTDGISASIIAQYANTKIPIKLSSITVCDREGSSCDEKYSQDILSIFDENLNINCIIVAIGLLHIPELKKYLNKRPDIKIITVNTVSQNQINPLIPKIKIEYPSVIDLLTIEQPYEMETQKINYVIPSSYIPPPHLPSSQSPTETFNVEVLYKNNEKVYKCPICQLISGSAAPKNPYNTSLFTHKFNCPNKNKIPVEN
jgi:hypothetical protein